MEKILSRVKEGLLLHVLYRKEDFGTSRIDLSPSKEFLQISSLVFEEGKEVAPHKHLPVNKVGTLSQESLILIEGTLEASYFDVDGQFLQKEILHEGDCTITFYGGHSFKSLSSGTKLYEVKNGPYLGKTKDWVKIDNAP